MHGKATANKRGLEARKARAATPEDIDKDEDEQGFLVADSPPPFPARADKSVPGRHHHHYWPTSCAPTISSSFTRSTQSSSTFAFTSGSTTIYSTTTPRTRARAGPGEAQESVYRNLQVGTRAGTFGVAWALAKLIHQVLTIGQAAAYGRTRADGRAGAVVQPRLYSYDGIAEIQQPR
jgi:hypothetical protein